jgi:hypothetical protein
MQHTTGGMQAASSKHRGHHQVLPCRTHPGRPHSLRYQAAPAQTPANTASSSSSSSSSSSEALLEWMQQHGCSVSGVGLFYEQQRDGSTSRELRATQVRLVPRTFAPEQHVRWQTKHV